MISFTCPKCAQPYQVSDESAGKRGKCKCGEAFTVPDSPVPPLPKKRSAFNQPLTLRTVGIILLLLGVAITVLALVMDTSMESKLDGKRVVNIGLMADRLTYLLLGLGTAVIGAVFTASRS